MNIGLTGRIARASARRPWLTIGAWMLIVVAAASSASSLPNYITPVEQNLVTTESDVAADLDELRRLAADGRELFAESVIVTSQAHRYGDAEFDTAIADATAALAGVEGVSSIVTPSNGAPVSEAGSAAFIQFRTEADTAVVEEAVSTIASLEHDGVETFVFGQESTLLAFVELAGTELARGEAFGLAAALVILIVVFGALVAAGLPLVVALVSIISATGVGAVVARIASESGVQIGDSLTIFIAMLGLALGIDYSLLAVQRFREELANGHSVIDAVTITGTTANRAVLFSGATIVVALGGMLVIPINSTLGVGVGVMTVALSAVTTTLFLLPAVLGLLGHRVNKGRVPTSHPGAESRAWRRLATAVVNRPALAGGVGVLLLLLPMLPLLGVKFAFPGPDSMPEDFVAHRANDVLVNDFGWTDSATVIAIDNAGDSREAVDSLALAVEADEAFAGTAVSWVGDVAYVDTNDAFDASDPRSKEAIERLRESLIPTHLASTDAEAFVGGARADRIDQMGLMTSRAPLAVGLILGLSFLLLLVMFRSIVIPLKAIAMNLLGTAATFGAIVAMFQWGWGNTLFGFPELDGVSPFLPVLTFALVFGLSMDYHVFLLSRVKERYDATGDTKTAVIEGLTRTGPLITGAALIMIAVFSGFAAAAIPELSQWGFGLAFGVAIDAAVIRVLLVPAAMVWLDRSNWYLPRWLQWLPQVTVEAADAPAPLATKEEREPALV